MGDRSRAARLIAWIVPQTACAVLLIWLQVAFVTPAEEPAELVTALLLALCATGLATIAVQIGWQRLRPSRS